MKIGIIIETNEPEKAWNGVRFGNAALKKGYEVKIFACATCIKSRGQNETDVCPISTMNDCLEIVEWSERLVTF